MQSLSLSLVSMLTPFHRLPLSRRSRIERGLRLGAGGLLGGLGLLGCHELTGSQSLPAGTANPATYNTPAGARSLRNKAIVKLEFALPRFIVNEGLLTDELESNQIGASPGVLSSSSLPPGGSLDERILPALSSGTGTFADFDYANLQTVRAYANQALGALAAYDTIAADTATSKVLRGELYALEGYAEISLADFFCSGVPLSTLDFQHDFTYHASSTTAQVYQDALTKEDSAQRLADTSTQVLNLARVLRGRALLDLGQYAQAAQAVAAVPDGFQYQLAVQWAHPTGINLLNDAATVSDGEGANGLPYVSGGDPRTVVTNIGTSTTGAVLYFPTRYSPDNFTPFTVADWIEARLIRAEAALQAHDTTTWLAQLNDLREHALVTGQTTTLADTTDPGRVNGSDSARVSLLFHERAYWLFLTGHRQGDLRRLIRQYGRDPNHVYPTGPYLAPGAGRYGTDVNAPIPVTEDPNPLFHGCLNRDA